MWLPVDGKTGRPLLIGATDWPVLIHGAAKAGASFFTIALTAALVRRGEKVVFLCAHAQAINTLRSELRLTSPTMSASGMVPGVATSLEDMQLVTIMQRRGLDLVAAVQALHDLSDRIVVIKNIDELLTPPLFFLVQSQRRYILSGDINHLQVALSSKLMKTQILFSSTPKTWSLQRTAWPTYMAEVHRPRGISTAVVREVAEV